jgi:signal transduction histidine kinase
VVDGMLDHFYQHLRSFPETARFLQDPALVERLKRAQRAHFLRLCTGPYDDDYFESRLQVGFAHARIHLDPQWYLGAYLVQSQYLYGRIAERFAGEPRKIGGYMHSLWKIIVLDIALATDAYIYGGFVERSLADAHAFEAERARTALEQKRREEERREELLSMIVHDIRSPVAAMIATARAGLRRYRDTGEPPGKQFELIDQAGQNVMHIIDNVVAHARAPGGEMPRSREAFDVAEVVHHCTEQLLPFAAQTGHHLTIEEMDPTPARALDRTLVRRVISNLLMNACRHTSPGTQVRVSCRNDPGGWAVLTVSDDGPGVPPAVREQVFMKEAAKPARVGGTYVDSGLGLPFCRLACERMGGTIELDSPGGRGSRFTVRLPTG